MRRPGAIPRTIVPIINYYNPISSQIRRTPAPKRTPPKKKKLVRKAATKRRAKTGGCGFWGLGCVAHAVRKAASVAGNATDVTNLVNCVSHPIWGQCPEAAGKLGGLAAATATGGLSEGAVEALHRLLAIPETLTEPLWELVNAGYEANWHCRIASHATELDRRTLQRILARPGDLWLDVCGDGTEDE
jgi:hypothetical protein